MEITVIQRTGEEQDGGILFLHLKLFDTPLQYDSPVKARRVPPQFSFWIENKHVFFDSYRLQISSSDAIFNINRK